MAQSARPETSNGMVTVRASSRGLARSQPSTVGGGQLVSCSSCDPVRRLRAIAMRRRDSEAESLKARVYLKQRFLDQVQGV